MTNQGDNIVGNAPTIVPGGALKTAHVDTNQFKVFHFVIIYDDHFNITVLHKSNRVH